MKQSLILMGIAPFLFGCLASTTNNSVTDEPSSATLPSTPAPIPIQPPVPQGNGETLLKLRRNLDEFKFSSYKLSKFFSFGIMDHSVAHGAFINYFDQRIELIRDPRQDFTSIKVSSILPFGKSFDIFGGRISPEGKIFARSLTMDSDTLFESGFELRLNAKLTSHLSSSISFSHAENNFGTENKFMIEILGSF